ncbi:MAG: cell envelope integrity protein TolA [Opitutaceae bacterium]|nr:cell envelope integrity protein TolA [Opitutaceae bacterium]
MTAQSPSAYLTSIGLHALVIVLIALTMGLASRPPADALQVFELVAGEGNNYSALVAPKLGDPLAPDSSAQTVSLPVPVPTKAPEPAIVPVADVAPPTPDPVPPAPAPAAKAPATKAPAPTAAPNFVRDIKRLSEKRAANIEKKFKAEQKAAADRARKEAELEAKRMTKAEFDRLNAKGKATPTTKGSSAKVPSVAQGIRKGVLGGSSANREGGAGGTALERAEQDLTEAYISMIIQRIRQSLEQADFSDELSVRVQISVSSAGTLSGVKILTTSGSADFDRAVLEGFRNVGDLGPPPNRKGETFIFTVVAQDLSP